MIIGTCMITLRIPWASSLKDKRMVVKSLTDKMKHKFNISVAEVEEQDNHRVAVIGLPALQIRILMRIVLSKMSSALLKTTQKLKLPMFLEKTYKFFDLLKYYDIIN